MNKSNLIGIVLIGVVIVVYSVFLLPKQKPASTPTSTTDTTQVQTNTAVAATEESQTTSDAVKPAPVDSLYAFSQLMSQPAKEYTLQNEKLCVTFSTQGAMPVSAELADYLSYDSTQVRLFAPGDFMLNLPIRTNQNQILETKDLIWQANQPNDSTLLMTLPIDSSSYLRIIYTMPHEGYMLGMAIEAQGLGSLLQSNNAIQDLEMSLRIPRQERSWKFENQYSTIYYKYPADDVEKLKETKMEQEKDVREKIQWVAMKDKFFSTVLIGLGDTRLEGNKMSFKTEPKETDYIKVCNYKGSFAMDIRDGRKANFALFMGPLDYNMLKGMDAGVDKAQRLDLKRMIYVGGSLFRWINVTLIRPLIDFLQSFISNWGIIILLLTIIIKLVLSPLTFKSYMSQAKMRVLKPQVEAINAKYAGDDQQMMMKRSQATMQLYRNAGASPMSGCLPMLLQMPFLIALYMFFPTAIDLRGESFLWVKDLSTYDPIISWSSDIPFITGLLGGNHISLFCLLWAVTNIIYSRYTMSMSAGADNSQMKMMRLMPYIMTIMFFIFFNSNAAGLTYYYFISTLITILQFVASRLLINEDKVLARLEENQRKPKKKKGFMARLEQMQKEQEKLMREQNKKRR